MEDAFITPVELSGIEKLNRKAMHITAANTAKHFLIIYPLFLRSSCSIFVLKMIIMLYNTIRNNFLCQDIFWKHMKNPFAIQTFGLTKHFSIKGISVTALQDINLSIAYGEIFGLMGPNGAGKTTLFKILSTLLLLTSGEAFVAGYNINDADKVKESIGFVSSDERSFYWRLSGRENLKFFAALYSLSPSEIKQRIEWAAETIGIEEFIDRRFDSYSTGMKQKISIARSLISKPRVLFVDEPTKGLDPMSASHIAEILKNLSDGGITLFIITHNTEEARELCERVAVMNKGRILAELKPKEADLKGFLHDTLRGEV